MSAITPPVAVASYAASTITRADPILTSFSAVRSGIVMFVIPFVFAFYPEVLLIDAARLSPDTSAGAVTYLRGYGPTIDWIALTWLLCRLTMALFLLASAIARFDLARLGVRACLTRIAIAAVLMSSLPLAPPVAFAVGLGLIILSRKRDLNAQNT